jgi:hypothetical protein
MAEVNAEKLTLTAVQEFSTDPATGLRRLKRERHYVRMRGAPDTPPIYIQSGKCWTESGAEIDPVPDWVLEYLDAMPAATREGIGWSEPARG